MFDEPASPRVMSGEAYPRWTCAQKPLDSPCCLKEEVMVDKEDTPFLGFLVE